MITTTLRRVVSVFALSLICVTGALAQSPDTAAWEGATGKLVDTKQKVEIVTIAEPTRRQMCRVDSIEESEIVCRHHGHTVTFQANDVAALILHGGTPGHVYFLRFLAAGGTAIFGGALLSLMCPTCAVAAVVAGLVFFAMAPVSAIYCRGNTGDTLLYLAPGQTLRVKLD